ncbi:sulfotransferase [Mycobacterium sp. 1165196.3]|uniref:sulfotransferase n=1 Tax=Mycobacterium sp. 1165196.3 TaxID=1834071 RepID=UPI003516F815
MCSLAQHTAEGWSTSFTGAQIGADAMETWSRGLERFNTARAKYSPSQFYDVDHPSAVCCASEHIEAMIVSTGRWVWITNASG